MNGLDPKLKAVDSVMPKASHLIKRLLGVALLLVLAPAARPLMGSSASLPPGSATYSEKIGQAAKGNPEQMLIAAIDAIRAGKLADASATVDHLLELEPNYRLAHLLRADLYAMQAAPLSGIGSAANGPADRLEDLRREALVRVKFAHNQPDTSLRPANLLVFSSRQKYAIIIDASAARLYVFKNENGTPLRIRDHYVTVGKLGTEKLKEGDQRTPLGVYFVTSYMSRNQLDKSFGAQADLYGIGAWPISYPNEWDQREGKTGHGIWLHGSPAATYARPPQASNGCVVLTNTEMKEIAGDLQIGVTPVVIVPKIEWLTQSEWQIRHEQATSTLERWRRSWENLDTSGYLANYSTSFLSDDGMNIDQWRLQKTAVNSSKKWIKLGLEETSIFASGGPNPMLVTSFYQDYHSNNLDNKMKKRLYWRQENGQWKIVWEGSAAT